MANGKKDVSVLENFVPRLGSLLEHQCSKVNKLSWTLNDPEGTTLAQGTAAKAQDWALVVKQQQAAPAETVTATQPAARYCHPIRTWLPAPLRPTARRGRSLPCRMAATCAPSGRAARPLRRSLFRILTPPAAVTAAG